MKSVIYPTPNIKCDGCAATINNTLEGLSGVDRVQVDVDSKRVSVDYDDTIISDKEIRTHLAQVGFPPEN
jgi:copper chaperone